MAALQASSPNAIESLNDLLSELDAAAEMQRPYDTRALLSQAESLLLTSRGKAGLTVLMRLWTVILRQRVNKGLPFSAAEVASAAPWFHRLQHYLAGNLPLEDRPSLAQLPVEIAGVARLKPALVDEIVHLLSLGAPVGVPRREVFVAPVESALQQNDQSTTAAAQNPTIEMSVAADPVATVGFSFAIADNADAVDDANRPSPSMDTDVARQDAFAAEDVPPPPGESFIWIGDEERGLIRTAVAEELMPLAQRWEEGDASSAQAQIADAFVYQSELIANVLEIMGTPQLARGISAFRAMIVAKSQPIESERLLEACSALLAIIEQPGEETALLLGSLIDWVPALDLEWLYSVAEELARVRIGRDPAQVSAYKRDALDEDVALEAAADTLPAVLDGMLRELPGHTERLGAAIRAAVMQGDTDRLVEARRISHTLKGDANTVGVRGLASITHALEDILDAYAKHDGTPDSATAELLVDSSDKIEEVSDFLLGRGPRPEGMREIYQRLLNAANALEENGADSIAPSSRPEPISSPDDPANAVRGADAGTSIAPAAAPAQSVSSAVPEAQTASAAAASTRSLTLGSDVLDHLQDLAGQTTIVSQGIDRLLEGIVAARRDQEASNRHAQELLSRLDDLVAMRGAALQSTAMASGAELDPLEIDQYNELHVIARQLAEAQADAGVATRGLRRTLSLLADLRSEQEQVNRELQQSILRTRMVPFAQVVPRLQRITRQTTKQLMKDVELQITGEETLVDAELLERIVEPLGHLIRNAIDHGLESAEERLRVGKSETARLYISVGVQGDSAIIDLRDDGRGLDFAAIRARAIGAGLLADDAVVDERRLTRFVLLPGFSTRNRTTEISGRGVGLDVVNQRVTELRGTLQLFSKAGQGLEAKLRLPVTQTLANVILVSGLRHRTAVVTSSVEQIVGVLPDQCHYDEARSSLSVTIAGQSIPALPIETVYREGVDIGIWLTTGGRGLLMRNALGDPVVVLVRAVEEVRSVVVKPVSALLPAIPAVRGITQLPDGGLAPVVDLDQLLARSADSERTLRIVSAHDIPRIVVADDSLSVRRSLEQLMRDAGYEVDVASDGFEAIALVEARSTALLLLDMEMPRMNGLEVARNLRNKPASRGLPIVMITSRTAEKHLQMAEEAGVTTVLSKPVSEDFLVTMVSNLIAAAADRPADVLTQ